MNKIEIYKDLFIIQDFITNKNIRPGTKYAKKSITIHSTGNADSTSKNELGWLNNPNNDRIASWHFAVDDKEIYQAIPSNETAYHAGKKEGNERSIGIEICESGDRLKTLQNAVKLIKYLKKTENIEKIVKHYDWTKKNCPRILIDKNYIKNNLDYIWFINEINKKEEVIVVENEKSWQEQAFLDSIKKLVDNGKLQKEWLDIKQWKKEFGEDFNYTKELPAWFILILCSRG